VAVRGRVVVLEAVARGRLRRGADLQRVARVAVCVEAIDLHQVAAGSQTGQADLLLIAHPFGVQEFVGARAVVQRHVHIAQRVGEAGGDRIAGAPGAPAA
jgi:hypothetical protein